VNIASLSVRIAVGRPYWANKPLGDTQNVKSSAQVWPTAENAGGRRPPHLRRREPIQVLVRSGMVVEEGELLQHCLQCCLRGDDQLAQQRLQGSKQALNPAVAPGRAHGRALVADADQAQERSEVEAGEHDLAVGADAPGLAVSANGQAQVAWHRPTALVGQRAQASDQAQAVVQNAHRYVQFAAGVDAERQVHGPHGIDGNRAGPFGTRLLAQAGQCVLIGLQTLRRKALAYEYFEVQRFTCAPPQPTCSPDVARCAA